MMINIDKCKDRLLPYQWRAKESTYEKQLLELIDFVNSGSYIQTEEDKQYGIVCRYKMPKFIDAETLYDIFSEKGYYLYRQRGDLLLGTRPLCTTFPHIHITQVVDVVRSITLSKNPLQEIVFDCQSVMYLSPVELAVRIKELMGVEDVMFRNFGCMTVEFFTYSD